MYHKDIGSCEMYRHKTNARVQIPEGEKFMNERNVRPFSKRDEIGYVFGDMAGSFVNLFVDAYFLTFCTYVLGISPAWMGSLFLAARLWDADLGGPDEEKSEDRIENAGIVAEDKGIYMPDRNRKR